MPTPAITASTRYINPGVTLCYFLPSVAAANLTPTRAEMDAGTNLSREISDINGWVVSSSVADAPDLATTFTGQIPARTSAAASSITFYASSTPVDARNPLPRGTTGYIMWLDGGDVVNRKADVFPIRVTSNGKPRTTGEDPAKIVVECSISTQPAENVTIPA